MSTFTHKLNARDHETIAKKLRLEAAQLRVQGEGSVLEWLENVIAKRLRDAVYHEQLARIYRGQAAAFYADGEIL